MSLVQIVGSSNPARGMRTDPDPTTLGQGLHRLLVNLRCRRATLAVRDSSVLIGGTAPVANASLRGYWAGYIGGSYRMVAAFRVGGATNLYSYSLSGNTWTAITGASFATDGQVQFAPADTRSSTTPSVSGLSILVAQNGSNAPICWNVAGTTAAAISTAGTTSGTSYAYCKNTIDMGTAFTITAPLHAAEWNLTAGADYLILTAPAAASTGSWYVQAFGNAFYETISNSRANLQLNGQYVMVIMDPTTSPSSPWDRVTKVEVYDTVAAAFTTIYEPAAGTGSVVVRDLPTVTGYSRVRIFAYAAGALEGKTISGFKITKDTQTPTALETCHIAFIGTTGLNLSSTIFASSQQVLASGQEGKATPYLVGNPLTFVSLQGSNLLGSLRWPVDANIFTSYYLNGSTSGGPGFANINLLTYASISGSEYGLTAVNGYLVVYGNRFDEFHTNDVPNYLFNPYDETAVVMPTGTAIASVNGRVVIGAGPKLWQSGFNDPMHWQPSATVDADGNIDETSPDSRSYPGEFITALRGLPGVVFGVGSLAIFTLSNMYRLAIGKTSQFGSYTSIVGNRGCRHPYSISIMDGSVWFLDSENRVRYTSGGSDGDSPSLDKVNQRIAGGTLFVSGVDRVCGIASFDYYAMYYPGSDPATGTADTIPKEGLIYDFLTGEWVLDRFPFDIAGVVTIDDGSVRRILGITTAGLVWELYRPGQTTENSANLPFRIESREYVSENWDTAAYKAMAVLADATAGETWTTRRLVPIDGTTTDGTINMGVATALAYRKDQGTNGALIACSAVSCIPMLYGNAPSGTRIRQLVIDTDERLGGPDRS